MMHQPNHPIKNANTYLQIRNGFQDYYNPVIGVLSTSEVNALCHKNNLSMVEMLEPFARLNSDVTIKDPEGITHNIPNLSLTFQDFHKGDPARNIGPRLLSDTVASITEEPLVSRAFPTRSLQLEAPGKLYIYEMMF